MVRVIFFFLICPTLNAYIIKKFNSKINVGSIGQYTIKINIYIVFFGVCTFYQVIKTVHRNIGINLKTLIGQKNIFFNNNKVKKNNKKKPKE